MTKTLAEKWLARFTPPKRTDTAEGVFLSNGWRILCYHEQRGDHNYVNRVVLATPRQVASDNARDMMYCVWRMDDLGGCFLGHYFDDLGKAQANYLERIKSPF